MLLTDAVDNATIDQACDDDDTPFPQLPQELLDMIQYHRRLGEAYRRRERILRFASLEYAWAPLPLPLTAERDCYKYHRTFHDLIIRVPTSNAIPFHNIPPWEVYEVDGTRVRVGMWEDRNNLLYVNACDIQHWNHLRAAPIGTHIFLNSEIRCKRILYENAWVDV